MSEKAELENKLIRAKIKKLERESSLPANFFNATVPLLQALIISVVASWALTNSIAKFYEKQNDAIKKETGELEIKKARIQDDVEHLSNVLLAIKQEKVTLEKEFRGVQTLYTTDIQFKVSLKESSYGISTSLTSNVSNINYKAYDFCSDTVSFPGQLPDFTQCRELDVTCSESELSNTCDVQVIYKMTNEPSGYWILAEANAKSAVRFIYLP